jgi:5-methylcytosine-specific restriction protein A
MTRVTSSGEIVEQLGRSVPEWVADHPDQAIPRRVKARIWLREGGRCYLTGKKIDPLKDAYEFEHVIPVGLDGSGHRESNIRLALKDAHKAKTADDRGMISKADRLHAKHNGYWPKSKHPLKGRGFGRSRDVPKVGGARG